MEPGPQSPQIVDEGSNGFRHPRRIYAARGAPHLLASAPIMGWNGDRGGEIMDRPDLPLADTERALADLERVNRWLFGLRPVLRALGPRLAAGPRRQTLVDLGTGSGQVAEALRRRAARHGTEVTVIGVDRKLSHLVFARARGARQQQVVACVKRLPLRDAAVDWSLSTLLLHHFDPSDGRAHLAEMARVAHRGAAIVDLRRALPARMLIRLALPLLGIARVARHDGRVSTDTAWTLDQVRRLARGFSVAELRRRFPFRFSLLVRPPSPAA